MDQQKLTQLLNDAGMPSEFYDGSLSLQTAPVALRLFEPSWLQNDPAANSFFVWQMWQINQILNRDPLMKRGVPDESKHRESVLLENRGTVVGQETRRRIACDKAL